MRDVLTIREPAGEVGVPVSSNRAAGRDEKSRAAEREAFPKKRAARPPS